MPLRCVTRFSFFVIWLHQLGDKETAVRAVRQLRLQFVSTRSGRSDRVKCVDLHPNEPWVLSALRFTASTCFPWVTWDLGIRVTYFYGIQKPAHLSSLGKSVNCQSVLVSLSRVDLNSYAHLVRCYLRRPLEYS